MLFQVSAFIYADYVGIEILFTEKRLERNIGNKEQQKRSYLLDEDVSHFMPKIYNSVTEYKVVQAELPPRLVAIDSVFAKVQWRSYDVIPCRNEREN